MALPQKLLARTVVVLLLVGMLPAFQAPAVVDAQDTATYSMTKYDCAPGYDPGSGDAGAAFVNCVTPAAGVTFTLLSGDASYGGGGAQATNGSGQASWSGIPLGTGYSITEAIPNGYGVPWVSCEVSGNPNNPGDVQRSFFQAPGGTMDVGYTDPNLTAYTQANCTWFNIVPNTAPVETTSDESGSITVTKYLCDRIAVQEGGSGVTYEVLSTQCTEYGEGFAFSVTSTSGSQNGSTDANGVVSFDGLAPGTATIAEALPTGYDSWGVYCKTDNPGDVYSMYADKQIYQFDYTVDAGVHLACSWFDQRPTNANSIKVVKYLCANGDFTTTPDFDGLTAVCRDPGADWQVALTTPDGTRGGTTGPDGSITIGFDTAGQVALAEVIQPSYSPLALYCNDGSSANAWTAFPLLSDGTTASASLDMSTGGAWTCYLFNVAPATASAGQTITITKYTCDNFLVRGSPTRTDYETYCTAPASAVEFTLYAGMGVVDTKSTDAIGVAVLTVPAAGRYQIRETPVDDYVTAAVYCMSSATDDPAVAEPIDPVLTIDVTADYPVTCVWYNAKDIWTGETYDPGTIVVHKYNCPPGAPTDSTIPYEGLLEVCMQPAEGISFSVNQGGNQVASGATDPAGVVTMTGASIGATRISELPIEGWDAPRVFCADVPVGPGRTLVSYDEMTVTTWGIDHETPADRWLDCVWFDRLPNQGMDGQPIQIIIHKYLCDPGIDEPGDTYAGASTECPTPESGVEFTVTGGDNVSATGPTDTNGYAEFNGLAPGFIHVSETPRPDYTTGAVFCSYSYGMTVYDYAPVTFNDESIALYLAPGYKLDCAWYNTVEGPTGHIYVFKYFCDEERSYTSTDDFADCAKSDAGVPFAVEIGAESWSVETDGSGLAAFYDLPVTTASPAVIREQSPDGYRPYAIFCGYSVVAYVPPTVFDELSLTADGDAVEAPVNEDMYLMCYWYNVADHHDPQVWISKYNCHEGADWHWSYHQLLSNCSTPAPGVEFGFGPEGSGPLLSITDDQGRWLYDSLTPGTWYWTESYPSGYSGAVVYCQWSDAHTSGEYQKAELDGATLWLEVEYDQIVTCYWFDFPDGQAPASPTPHSGGGGSGGSGGSGSTPPPPLSSNLPTGGTGGTGGNGGSSGQPTDPNAPATLIIVKRTCPAGYDMYAEDADVEADCTDLTEGIDFELTSLITDVENGTPVPNDPVPQATGKDGKATWANLGAGPYLLVESLPEETYAAFIWTCTSDAREFQLQFPLTPFSYAGPDGETGITLIGGETLECAWYDVPVGKATVTILAFECPGSPVILAQCESAGAGAQFSLAPVGASGVILQLTTGEDGSATVEGAAGLYKLTESGGAACLIDSEAFDEQGQLLLAEGSPVEVRVYHCAGGS